MLRGYQGQQGACAYCFIMASDVRLVRKPKRDDDPVLVRNEIPSDEILQHKIWIGNLDRRLTEYHLMQICKQYGAVKHLVYVFHTRGPQKGEPRGYCFVEFSNRQEADKARLNLNGKIAIGRQLKVDWARPSSSDSELNPQPTKPDVKHMNRKQAEDKIREIEAKLKSMEGDNPLGTEKDENGCDHKLKQSDEKRYAPYSATGRPHVNT